MRWSCEMNLKPKNHFLFFLSASGLRLGYFIIDQLIGLLINSFGMRSLEAAPHHMTTLRIASGRDTSCIFMRIDMKSMTQEWKYVCVSGGICRIVHI